MEGRGFAFVTFADPRQAQAFLEVREKGEGESGKKSRELGRARARERRRGRRRWGDQTRPRPLSLHALCSPRMLFAPRFSISLLDTLAPRGRVYPDRAPSMPPEGSRRARPFRSCGRKRRETSVRGRKGVEIVGREGIVFSPSEQKQRSKQASTPFFSRKVKKRKEKNAWTVQKSSPAPPLIETCLLALFFLGLERERKRESGNRRKKKNSPINSKKKTKNQNQNQNQNTARGAQHQRQARRRQGRRASLWERCRCSCCRSRCCCRVPYRGN